MTIKIFSFEINMKFISKKTIIVIRIIKFCLAFMFLTGWVFFARAEAQAAIELVQRKTNKHTYGSPANSIATTFDAAAAADNLIVTGIAIDKNSGTITVPEGFSLVHKGEGQSTTASCSGAMAYKIAAGGETTITWSWSVLQEGTAWVGEFSGLAASNVLDRSAENDDYLETVTASVGTTTLTTTQADELAVAMYMSDSSNAVGTARSWTNGFTFYSGDELPVPADSGQPFINVATTTLSSTQAVNTTLSHDGSDESYLAVATFKAASASASTLTQAAYKWFVNDNSTAVGRGAAQNQAITAPAQGTPFRLRMLLHAGTAPIAQSATTSLLQFAVRSGSCDTAFAGESYGYMSSTTGAIRYYDNSGASDGAALTASAKDPRHGTDTVRNQVYTEGSNNFSNSQSAVNAGEDGLWDFSLVDFSAAADIAYCFRAVQAGGGTLNSYTVIPEITTYRPMKIKLRSNVKLRKVFLR